MTDTEAEPPARKPRKPITWNLEPRVERRPAAKVAAPIAVNLECGWKLLSQSGKAYGQGLARSSARAIRAAVSGHPERPWAVRGEVPLDDERSACGCTTIVFGGIPMKLPEKIFGDNWLEIQHVERKIAICFDSFGALCRWAQLSRGIVDDRRAGKPAWSGWTCNAADLHETWQQSAWGSITNYSRREEWDWSYRTDYGGTVRQGGHAIGSCARAASALQEHVLIRTSNCGSSSNSGTGRASERETSVTEPTWSACSEDEYEAAIGEERLWGVGAVLSERYVKLYEDLLSELGVSRCDVRFREFEMGWEVHVRWWSCLNPGMLPKRGVPHARLRETLLRLRYETDVIVRRIEERLVNLTSEVVDSLEGASVIDPESMREHMKLVSASEPSVSRLMLTEEGVATGFNDAVDVSEAHQVVSPMRPMMKRHDLGACCTSLTSVSDDMMSIGAAASGDVVFVHKSDEVWRASHRGVEAMAYHMPSEAVITSGDDGFVRFWERSKGKSIGMLALNGVDSTADRMPDGSVIIQCIVASGEHVAAACGSTVVTLSVPSTPPDMVAGAASSMINTPSSARPPLPSTVSALCFGSDTTGAILIAGTLHSGVYVWDGAQLVDPRSAASRWLDCKSSVDALAWHPELPWPITASCRDRTVRAWSEPPNTTHGNSSKPPKQHCGSAEAAAALVASAPVCVPMTFGSLTSGPRGGSQTAAVKLPTSVHGGSLSTFAPEATSTPADLPETAQLLVSHSSDRWLLMADDRAGLLTWRFPNKSSATVHDTLGLDSRCGSRLLLPDGRRALCLALRPHLPDGSHDAPPELACGCADGTIVVLSLCAQVLADHAAAWRVLKLADSQDCLDAVTQLAWSADGSWLHAAVGRQVYCVSMRA